MKERLSASLRKRLVFTVVPTLALLVFFTRSTIVNPPERLASLFVAALLTFLFLLLGIRFIPVWMQAWGGLPELDAHAVDGKRSGRYARLHPFWRVVLLLALFRVALFLLAYLFAIKKNGYQGGVFDTIGLWNPVSFDARHYLSIAENWYQPQGEDRFLLVFFPFYPIVVRIFHVVFRDYLISGLFVSNVACVFAGYVFYELALIDMDRDTAMRSLKYLCVLPASVLLSAPLSDSLFLLLSVSVMYFARKKNYPAACVLGFFAAFTRLLGVLLFVPVCFEVVADVMRDRREGRTRADETFKRIVDIASLAVIPLGLGLYLFINYRVSGNAFQFLTYQAENWQQTPGWFFHTAGYQFDSLLASFSNGSLSKVLGLWLPNLIFLFGSLALVLAAVKKLRPSYTAYFVAYYLISMGATWLLSAPRYMVAAFPVSLALGLLTKNKWTDAFATTLCALGLVGYLYAFVMHWNVY